ncbi:MAG: hypothetical protein AAF567_17170 [Actinomycetota bacterium]
MQFARDHPEITIVGMGAGSAVNGDSLALALDFVERHQATLPNMTMLYDVSFRSWRNFGVISQPWSFGYDAAGTQVFSLPGRIDLASVSAALS